MSFLNDCTLERLLRPILILLLRINHCVGTAWWIINLSCILVYIRESKAIPLFLNCVSSSSSSTRRYRVSVINTAKVKVTAMFKISISMCRGLILCKFNTPVSLLFLTKLRTEWLHHWCYYLYSANV